MSMQIDGSISKVFYSLSATDISTVTAVAEGTTHLSSTESITAYLQQNAVASADGAIALTSGTVFITKTSAAALTLAAPTPGTDDGKTLTIIGTTAFAHTVTTPSNKINGNKHVETYANVGDACILKAYNGVWYQVSATTTLS